MRGATSTNRSCLLAIAALLIVAMTVTAQEHGQRGSQDDQPTVETQLKVLTEKLDLTCDQQAKVKPIIKKLHNRTQKLMQNENLSNEERLAKIRPERFKAEKQIRELLADRQRVKLDEFLHGPHPEMHGNLSGGSASRGNQPPQN